MVKAYINNKFSLKISSVAVNKNTVTINGAIGNGQNFYLCELRMFDETNTAANNFASVTPINANAGTFRIQLPRLINDSDSGYDRIYSRWMIAVKKGSQYSIQSFAHYADNIYNAANQYLPEEKPESIKGLAGFWNEGGVNQDLTDLNIKNVTINFVLPSFISLTPTDLAYKFNGQTYYFKSDVVTKFDNALKLCASKNIFVSAILFIQTNITGQLKSIFTYSGSNGGVQTMANITSLTGLNYYAAVVSFLAERYTRADKQFGRINSWIVHNEVDNGAYWTNAGNAKLQFYTELYDRSVRTVYYTVRQYDPAAKVYLSLSHFWAGSDKSTFFPPQDLLQVFNRLSKEQGDYEWGIAYHPYPQDLFNPEAWTDKDATTNINTTKYITPKNIELIDQWLCMKSHLYNGLKVRSLLLSEQGVNSKSYSKDDLTAQAAGLAYMWEKFSRLPTLEAFDYHRQTDNKNEGGFKPGLWTVKQGTIVTPDQKKPAWYAYYKAGTKSQDSAFAFALPLIGVSNWSQINNPVTEEAPPVQVTFKVSKNGSVVNDATINFNGEIHKTINGSAIFYNVAILPNARNYVISENDKTSLLKQNIVIGKSQVVSINLP